MTVKEKYEIIKKELTLLHSEIGKPKIVLGLSGGVDSAVVAALVADILGKEYLIAVNMPTVHNSDKTQDLAKQIAENLGLEYSSLNIQDILDLMVEKLFVDSDIEKGNLAARIRNNVLQTIATAKNGVVVCNTNKLEYMTGYTTYPDIGFCSPIGDLTKMEVFEMAEYLNNKFDKNVIPQKLLPNENMELEVFPSAELEEGQKDPFMFGLDCELIDYVSGYNYLDDGMIKPLISKWGEIYNIKNVNDRFLYLKKLYEKSHFKRQQSPPIIKLKE